MPFIKLTKIERKRFLVLLTCVLLTIAGWLFLALNNKYVYTAKTVLMYKNFPQKKAFHPLQSDTVDLLVEGTGWQLLFARLRINPQYISISLDKLNNRNYVLFSEQLYAVNNQLETSQKIISVRPDTLYFDFSKRTVKKVPVVLVPDLKFSRQFDISGPIEFTPNYVTVSGPQEELEKIDFWKTDTLRLQDIHSNRVSRIAVKQNVMKNISVFPGVVEVRLPVDEFTEKTVEVPLKILNNKEFYNVKLFPKKVKVTFLVALSSYQQVNEDFIEAAVDLNEWKENHHGQLTVRLTRFPEYCKKVMLTPGKVDFIIEK